MRKIKCMPYVVFCNNDNTHPEDDAYQGGGSYDGW